MGKVVKTQPKEPAVSLTPAQTQANTSPALFTAVAHNLTGATGESWIDGGLAVRVVSPLGGQPSRSPAGSGAAPTNPEELLALSWATCLNAAARVVAGPGVEVAARVKISLHERAGDGYEFAGHAVLTFEGKSGGEADRLAAAAHARCPVSRMLAGGSTVTVTAAHGE
ncbi:OsmC family protein [Leucobacter komagatae]